MSKRERVILSGMNLKRSMLPNLRGFRGGSFPVEGLVEGVDYPEFKWGKQGLVGTPIELPTNQGLEDIYIGIIISYNDNTVDTPSGWNFINRTRGGNVNSIRTYWSVSGNATHFDPNLSGSHRFMAIQFSSCFIIPEYIDNESGLDVGEFTPFSDVGWLLRIASNQTSFSNISPTTPVDHQLMTNSGLKGNRVTLELYESTPIAADANPWNLFGSEGQPCGVSMAIVNAPTL